MDNYLMRHDRSLTLFMLEFNVEIIEQRIPLT